MEFLKKMRSRDMIEMGIKTVMSIILGLILIILMEGMIYHIHMNKIEETLSGKGTQSSDPANSIAYCEQIDTDKYRIYEYHTGSDGWQIANIDLSKDEIHLKRYKDVVWRKPNAFDVSITPIHYVVMAGFIVAILAVNGFGYYKIQSDYRKYVKKFNRTGNIFA